MKKLTISNEFTNVLEEYYREKTPELDHLHLEALSIRIKLNFAEIDRDKQKIIDVLKATKIMPTNLEFINHTPEAEAVIIWASDFTIELSEEGNQVILNDFIEFVEVNFGNFDIIDASLLYFLEDNLYGYKEKIFNPRFKAECFNSEDCRLSVIKEDFIYSERFKWDGKKGVPNVIDLNSDKLIWFSSIETNA